jgi:hypothetical protein
LICSDPEFAISSVCCNEFEIFTIHHKAAPSLPKILPQKSRRPNPPLHPAARTLLHQSLPNVISGKAQKARIHSATLTKTKEGAARHRELRLS